jgi:hypothetical protein
MTTTIKAAAIKPAKGPEQAQAGGDTITISAARGALTLSLGWFASLTISSEDQFTDLVSAIMSEAEVAFPDLKID